MIKGSLYNLYKQVVKELIKQKQIKKHFNTKGKEVNYEVECKYCESTIDKSSNPKIWWDESGTESVKLMKCPFCGKIQVIKYEPSYNLNYDERYYK